MADEKIRGNVRVIRTKHPEPVLTDEDVAELVVKHKVSVETLGIWAYMRYLTEIGKTEFEFNDLLDAFPTCQLHSFWNSYQALVTLGYIDEE